MPTAHVDSANESLLRDIANSISKARKILVITGAGISTSSGIPDFRSENGLYSLIQARFNAADPGTGIDGANRAGSTMSSDAEDHRQYRPAKRRKIAGGVRHSEPALRSTESRHTLVSDDDALDRFVDENTGAPAHEENRVAPAKLEEPLHTRELRAPMLPPTSDRGSGVPERIKPLDGLGPGPPSEQCITARPGSACSDLPVINHQDPSAEVRAAGAPGAPPSSPRQIANPRRRQPPHRSLPPQNSHPAASSPLSSPPPLCFDPNEDSSINESTPSSGSPCKEPSGASTPRIPSQASFTSSSSGRASLPNNLKGKDLFDAQIWADPVKTSVFYTFTTVLRRKARQVHPTSAHEFIRVMRDRNTLVRLYTQNVENLHERTGLSTQLALGAGTRYRFSVRAGTRASRARASAGAEATAAAATATAKTEASGRRAAEGATFGSHCRQVRQNGDEEEVDCQHQSQKASDDSEGKDYSGRHQEQHTEYQQDDQGHGDRTNDPGKAPGPAPEALDSCSDVNLLGIRKHEPVDPFSTGDVNDQPIATNPMVHPSNSSPERERATTDLQRHLTASLPPVPGPASNPPTNRVGSAASPELQDATLAIAPESSEKPATPKGGVECVMLHGSLDALRCFFCARTVSWDAALEAITLAGEQPTCPHCACATAARQERGKRALGVGKLRPDIVLYGEEHPQAHLIGPIVQHDLSLQPDMLLIMGTSLHVHGLKVLVKEFSRAVHNRGGMVVFVNWTSPGRVWNDVLDVWVEMAVDDFIRDLRRRKPVLWLPPGSQVPAEGEGHQDVTKARNHRKSSSGRRKSQKREREVEGPTLAKSGSKWLTTGAKFGETGSPEAIPAPVVPGSTGKKTGGPRSKEGNLGAPDSTQQTHAELAGVEDKPPPPCPPKKSHTSRRRSTKGGGAKGKDDRLKPAAEQPGAVRDDKTNGAYLVWKILHDLKRISGESEDLSTTEPVVDSIHKRGHGRPLKSLSLEPSPAPIFTPPAGFRMSHPVDTESSQVTALSMEQFGSTISAPIPSPIEESFSPAPFSESLETDSTSSSAIARTSPPRPALSESAQSISAAVKSRHRRRAAWKMVQGVETLVSLDKEDVGSAPHNLNLNIQQRSAFPRPTPEPRVSKKKRGKAVGTSNVLAVSKDSDLEMVLNSQKPAEHQSPLPPYLPPIGLLSPSTSFHAERQPRPGRGVSFAEEPSHRRDQPASSPSSRLGAHQQPLGTEHLEPWQAKMLAMEPAYDVRPQIGQPPSTPIAAPTPRRLSLPLGNAFFFADPLQERLEFPPSWAADGDDRKGGSAADKDMDMTRGNLSHSSGCEDAEAAMLSWPSRAYH